MAQHQFANTYLQTHLFAKTHAHPKTGMGFDVHLDLAHHHQHFWVATMLPAATAAMHTVE